MAISLGSLTGLTDDEIFSKVSTANKQTLFKHTKHAGETFGSQSWFHMDIELCVSASTNLFSWFSQQSRPVGFVSSLPKQGLTQLLYFVYRVLSLLQQHVVYIDDTVKEHNWPFLRKQAETMNIWIVIDSHADTPRLPFELLSSKACPFRVISSQCQGQVWSLPLLSKSQSSHFVSRILMSVRFSEQDFCLKLGIGHEDYVDAVDKICGGHTGRMIELINFCMRSRKENIWLFIIKLKNAEKRHNETGFAMLALILMECKSRETPALNYIKLREIRNSSSWSQSIEENLIMFEMIERFSERDTRLLNLQTGNFFRLQRCMLTRAVFDGNQKIFLIRDAQNQNWPCCDETQHKMIVIDMPPGSLFNFVCVLLYDPIVILVWKITTVPTLNFRIAASVPISLLSQLDQVLPTCTIPRNNQVVLVAPNLNFNERDQLDSGFLFPSSRRETREEMKDQEPDLNYDRNEFRIQYSRQTKRQKV